MVQQELWIRCECEGRNPERGPPLSPPPYKTAGLLKLVHTDRMPDSCCPPARPQTLTEVCVRICMLSCGLCLAGWPPSSEAAQRRCGPDLISDLIFVCGDRGIYLGKGSWSGYGARPRGKGIVDRCCRLGGCELQHLEMYCAKPKSQQHSTAPPATTTAPRTSTQQHTLQVFQKRLSEELGAAHSPRRRASRNKMQPSPPRNSKALSSRRRTNAQNTTTSRPPSESGSPPVNK